MKRYLLALTAGILAAATPSAFADAIPYAHTGTIAPIVATFASGNGINVYFLGSGATLVDSIQVRDLTSGFVSPLFFNNHTTAIGTEVSIGGGAGQIAANDLLVFYILTPTALFASVPSDSSDGVNHAYITNYSGGTVGTIVIPAGLYVGMEDLTKNASDFNYTDDNFVFTGVTAPSIAVTPEPSSIVLLGTGLLGIADMARRRIRRDS